MEPIVLTQLKKSKSITSSIIQPPSPSISTPHSFNDNRESYFSPVQKAVGYKSRFKEHFEERKSLIDKEPLPVSPLTAWHSPELRPGSLEAMRSFSETAIASHHPIAEKPILVRSACTTTDIKMESSLSESIPQTTSAYSPKMKVSLSTPQSISVTGESQQHLKVQDVSDHSQFSFSDQSISTASVIATNLNRADVLIQRLETWYVFLKSVVGWIEEIAKIHQQSSRGYSQKAKSCLDVNLAEDDSLAKSLLFKLQSVTTKAASDQRQFSKTLYHDHLSNLHKLRKECKGKIQAIKMDSALAMDELYRRAEITQRKMKTLNRCCKQAEKSNGQSETDPWLANLYVLRQLKREVDEENRLRLLMVPIQKEVKLFEARVLDTVQSTFRFSCKHLLPQMDGFFDDGFESIKAFMDTVVPEQEWEQFVNANKKEIVDENHPVKDYIKINYTNKSHPLVMTLIKGKMEKKSGARRQFVEKYYVLSQGGYLHQFTLDNKVSPEKTIYIPSRTATFPFEARNPSSANSLYMHYKEEELTESSNVFEIAKPGTSLLQKEKVSVFRASNKEDLCRWCHYLTKVSSGFDMTENQPEYISGNSSHLTMVSQLNSHFSVSSEFHMDSRHRGLDSEISLPSSPTRSTPLYKTDESLRYSSSFSQVSESPLTAFKRSNSSPQVLEHSTIPPTVIHPDFPINSILEETGSLVEENNNTQDNRRSNEDDDDLYSVTSSSLTEKDKTEQNSALSIMDDAQSSLYFSSTSAPPSPSYSTQSSVVSIPELWNV
ncbi:hypothetical protein BY458DRAFT_509365 [Sporodiniella umbellata]|nr:hypothetical protein BY458DRAFT_509365 [Sporodiniella umbellata]